MVTSGHVTRDYCDNRVLAVVGRVELELNSDFGPTRLRCLPRRLPCTSQESVSVTKKVSHFLFILSHH